MQRLDSRLIRLYADPDFGLDSGAATATQTVLAKRHNLAASAIWRHMDRNRITPAKNENSVHGMIARETQARLINSMLSSWPRVDGMAEHVKALRDA